jgi:5'-methylthioadenosine phosphorylase
MFRSFGCDVVGMTGLPEAILAHELGICYAALCFVSNMAASIENHISAEEVIERVSSLKISTNKILKECIDTLPRKRNCFCSSALEGARI